MDGEKTAQGVLLEHMVFQKTRTQSIADVRSLNMWGHELEDVSICSRMVNVETVALSINKIHSLAPFTNCWNLKNLLLRRNRISDFGQLEYLKGLPNLRSLSLCENPIADNVNYRTIVIQALPQIERLDDVDVSIRTVARKEAPVFGENTDANVPAYIEEPNTMKWQQKRFNFGHTTGANLRKSMDDAKRRGQTTFAEAPSWQEPRQHHEHHEPTNDDSRILTAVLSLIPGLSNDSVQIVLEFIRDSNRQSTL